MESWIQMSKNHPDIYDSYKERIIQFRHEMWDQTIKLQEDLDSIRSSHAYRLGKFLLKPFSWLKRRIGR